MISIIICSRKKTLPPDFLQNIASSIGVDYELIIIDNSENNYSIFQAYNLGIKKSKGDYWCFIHDDILFHTQNWGHKIKQIFDDNKNVGLIGVAGAKVKTKMPSGWWDCPHDLMVTNIIHQLPNKQKEKQYHGFNDEDNVEVAVIDGVFMFAKANPSVAFDEKLKGFHQYDINLALQYINQGLKIMVTNQVLIEHFSEGNLDESWLKLVFKFHKHYKNSLPLKVDNEDVNLKAIEVTNGNMFCNKLIENNFKILALRLWFHLLWLKPISKFHMQILKKLIIK